MALNELKNCLLHMKLTTILEHLEEAAETAGKESWSYEQFLFELVSLERQSRWERKQKILLRESRLPSNKTFSTLDRSRLGRTLNQHIDALIEGSFLDRCENVLAFGNPGSGKTHTICAIGHEMVLKGKRILFKNCEMLVQELLIAKRSYQLPQFLKKLGKFQALIIDDIGYVQQSREEMEVLFTLLADRYEKASTLITSNLPFSEWEKIFKDPMTTAAAIDRLVHHSMILELNLPSYRLEQAKKEKHNEQ
jgi:DNA replication protein DnaC